MELIDPWRRMSCVPPGAATAASKRPPSRSTPDLLAPLATDDPWLDAIERFRARSPRRTDRVEEYERLLEEGTHRRVADAVLSCRYQPSPPVEGQLNKTDGRKKRIFSYQPTDELLFRVVNRLLQPVAAEHASPWCRSFLPGGGARVAFRSVLGDPTAVDKAALRLDVRDYFNSIDVEDLLARLPEPMAAGSVAALLANALRDTRVERDGVVVDGGSKGVMAGTPLAPLLSTLYLRDVDRAVADHGTTYARYSDDIIVLAAPDEIPGIEHLIRSMLGARGLCVNESKSAVSSPGEPWDFLGFRFDAGRIGLAPVTEHKLKQRTTRLARSLLRWRERASAPPARALGAFVRRTNLRLYGVPDERADFSWATWFLPMLDGADQLHALDAHVQREARYAATGKRTGRTRRLVRYEELVEAGLLPLASAYWTLHDGGPAAYDATVSRRTGLGFRISR
jgi:hypothetical protein